MKSGRKVVRWMLRGRLYDGGWYEGCKMEGGKKVVR